MTLADLLAGAYSQLSQGPTDFRSRLPRDYPNADPRMFQGPPANWPFGLPMLNVPQQNLPQMPGYPIQGTLPT